MNCTTHHHACDCREDMLAKRIAELEKELVTTRCDAEDERLKNKRLRDAIADLNPDYWMGITDCNCDSPLPTGGCLHCDLKRLKEASCD